MNPLTLGRFIYEVKTIVIKFVADSNSYFLCNLCILSDTYLKAELNKTPAEVGEHDGGNKCAETSSKSKHHPLLMEVQLKD